MHEIEMSSQSILPIAKRSSRLAIISLLLLVFAPGCSLFRAKEPSLSREQRIQQCEKNLLGLDRNMFAFAGVRRCFCEKKVDGERGDLLGKCDATCLVSMRALDKQFFASEEFTRCMCEGIKNKLPRDEILPKCEHLRGR